ncbi:MAG: SUF system NifU family Fe-S cluster assembly protein [Epsilonproteobacteria bacterium]|jgi:nitrogen fixation NifU-like protein|nr:SUF system NifU family Fe-S cluster assembly protein [Campylobacterota bacterium]HPM07217.1 SUF system NifU family Fe-S cluster assembly protein [Bacilli bacterium]
MPISLDPQMMRAIIMDHYEKPRNKRTPHDDRYQMMHIDSPNCIDDINVFLLEENGVISDCAFDGIACTISTASTDIMTELVIGKNVQDALYIIEQYQKMIHEQPFDDTVLDEAIVFINTHRQAARIKCATIGWDALKELLNHDHKHEEK